MLVIHPKDKTTEMPSILYEGLEAKLIESDCSKQRDGTFASPHVSKRAYHAAWSWLRQRLILSQER